MGISPDGIGLEELLDAVVAIKVAPLKDVTNYFLITYHKLSLTPIDLLSNLLKRFDNSPGDVARRSRLGLLC